MALSLRRDTAAACRLLLAVACSLAALHTCTCSEAASSPAPTAPCNMSANCSNHGRCLGDGNCDCNQGWGGEHCATADGGGDPCVKNMYAEGCSTACTSEGTCNNHGRCMGDGACECYAGWSGEHCDRAHGGGEPCRMNIYGECDLVCTMEGTCSNHGRCTGDGSCECYAGWGGEHCDRADSDGGSKPCVTNLYGECDVVCTIEGTCNNHGRCMGEDGSCECYTGWGGERCDKAHGGGDDPCRMNLYGECDLVCSIEGTCSNHGRCMGDGSCECY
ncbi:hypothetical protein T484DRAFT_3276329, partial [Baffinella frigidus]